MMIAFPGSLARPAAAALASAAALLLTSCAPLMISGATTGGIAAASSRTFGAQMDDTAIEIKADTAIRDRVGSQARYSLISINRVVLVVGQAPSDEIRDEITSIVADIENVRQVHNHMSLGGKLAVSSLISDSTITAKVKANLLSTQEEGFSTLDIKVVTENSIVYLMGLVSRKAGAIAIRQARNTSGVHDVKALFEYLPDNQLYEDTGYPPGEGAFSGEGG